MIYHFRNFIKLEFKTKKEDGLLLYISDANHDDFLAVYLVKGFIVFAFNCGGGTARRQSTVKTDDGLWHMVILYINNCFSFMVSSKEKRSFTSGLFSGLPKFVGENQLYSRTEGTFLKALNVRVVLSDEVHY